MCHAAMLNQIVVSHHHHWDSPMGLEWYYYGTHRRRKDDHGPLRFASKNSSESKVPELL